MDAKLEKLLVEDGILLRQSTKTNKDNFTYKVQRDITEIDFMQRLGGPATHIEIQADQIFHFRYKNFAEDSDQDYPRNILANIPFVIDNENTQWLKVYPNVYPMNWSLYCTR